MKVSPGPIRWSAGQAEADDVDLEQRLADEVVEPLRRAGCAACAVPGCRRGSAAPSGVVTTPRIVCRVVCGFELVIATFWPTRALVSVDLPALGRPTRQANPAR